MRLLSRELARRGHEVTLLCQPGAWIAGQLAADPVEVMFSDLRRFPAGELRRVAGEIGRRRIEVVHTHMSRASLFGVLLRWFAGVPSIATAHSRHFQPHWMFNDLVIAVSEATRRYHRRVNLVRSERILTVHNFVPDSPAPQPAGGVRRQIRAELGVPDEAPLLGIVGSLFPPKGHWYLIRGLPEVVAAADDVRLAVVGRETPPRHVRRLRARGAAAGSGGSHSLDGRPQRRAAAHVGAGRLRGGLAERESSPGDPGSDGGRGCGGGHGGGRHCRMRGAGRNGTRWSPARQRRPWPVP